jgi:hypothetical protein
MNSVYDLGLDVHKKTIRYCLKPESSHAGALLVLPAKTRSVALWPELASLRASILRVNRNVSKTIPIKVCLLLTATYHRCPGFPETPAPPSPLPTDFKTNSIFHSSSVSPETAKPDAPLQGGSCDEVFSVPERVDFGTRKRRHKTGAPASRFVVPLEIADLDELANASRVG